jgi:hypothetical protein
MQASNKYAAMMGTSKKVFDKLTCLRVVWVLVRMTLIKENEPVQK